jgi:hypothetical protein
MLPLYRCITMAMVAATDRHPTITAGAVVIPARTVAACTDAAALPLHRDGGGGGDWRGACVADCRRGACHGGAERQPRQGALSLPSCLYPG